MKSGVIAFLAVVSPLLLSCMKQQPVVQAPIIVDIPPMEKSRDPVALPPPSIGPRLMFGVPDGWDVEDRQKALVSLRHSQNTEAVIVAQIEEVTVTDDPKQDAEDFHRTITDMLAQRGIVGSSYMFMGPNGLFTAVRYASETVCGTSTVAQIEGTPRQFVVVHGQWPCDVDVESDNAMQRLISSFKIRME